MLKYILLLCLILQLCACRQLHARERSQDVDVKSVETVVKQNVQTNGEIKDGTLKKDERNNVKDLFGEPKDVIKEDVSIEEENENKEDEVRKVEEPLMISDVIEKQVVEEDVKEIVGEDVREIVGDEVKEIVGDEVKEIVGGEVKEIVGDEVKEIVGDEAKEIVGDELKEIIGEEAKEIVGEDVKEIVGDDVKEIVGDEVKEIVGDEVKEIVGEDVKEIIEDVKQIVEEVKEVDQLKTLLEEDTALQESSGGLKQGIIPNLGIGNTCRVNNEVGTCVASALQCSTSRGTVLGGLGANGQCSPLSVCCQVTKTCSQSSSKRSVIFGNPTRVSPVTTNCEFVVNVADPKVCQMRLDFDLFQIANSRQTPMVGNSPFTCMDDSFTVISPSNEKIPTFCGFNTGQHIYVRLNTSNNERSIRLRFNLAGRPGMVNGVALTNPQWKIRVTQLECSSNRASRNIPPRNEFPLAPPGCLQYFPARTGTFRSFGFNPSSMIAANNYVANLDYSICFRRTPTTCGMKFTATAFAMSGNEHNCMQDYVYIPESVIIKADGSRTTIGLSRVCGQGNAVPPNAFIISVGNFPFYAHVLSDATSGGNDNGFNINYEVPAPNNCL